VCCAIALKSTHMSRFIVHLMGLTFEVCGGQSTKDRQTLMDIVMESVASQARSVSSKQVDHLPSVRELLCR
jgi:hypothetical protein